MALSTFSGSGAATTLISYAEAETSTSRYVRSDGICYCKQTTKLMNDMYQ